MSIYATLWKLKFPRFGDVSYGCDWVEVTAQGVPPHIGSPSPGHGYEDDDPYAEFLPPPLVVDDEGEHQYLRAVVVVTEETEWGHQEAARNISIRYWFSPAKSTQVVRSRRSTTGYAMRFAAIVQA